MTKVYLVSYYAFDMVTYFPVKVFKSKGLAEAWVLKQGSVWNNISDGEYDIQEVEYVDA